MTRLQKGVLWFSGAVALVGIGVANAEPDSFGVAYDALLQRPAKETGTIVVPERFVRPWDPVTIFFASDRGPRDGGAEGSPERHATMSPAHPGAWEWLDARTLQFRPAEPWPPLATFDWGAAEKKVRLTTLMQPPKSTVPANAARGLDPVDSITVTLPGPVREEVLARMVAIELRRLPGVGSAPFDLLGPEDYEIKSLERTDPEAPAGYVLRLHQPIGLGTQITVLFRLALGGDDETTVARVEFATAEPFRVTHFGCGDTTVPATATGADYPVEQLIRCSGDLRAQVVFSSPPGGIGPIEGRNLVRFEPGVEGLEFSLSGSQLVITGDFDREQAYRMALVPTALTDRSGRSLEMTGRNAVSLWFPRRVSYLRWQTSQGIAETFGPRHLPLEGRQDGKADLRIYAIDPLNRSFWPFPESPVSVDEAQAPPGPGEEAEPWASPYAIDTSGLRQRLFQLGTPGISRIVDLPLANRGSAATFGLDLEPHLAALSGRNVPGHYLVGLRRLDNSTIRSWIRLQVTDLSLTAVEETKGVQFVVTSLQDGMPVSGAQVRVEGRLQERRADTWTTFFSGNTDKQGIVHWNVPGDHPDRNESIYRVVVQNRRDILVLDANRPPQRYHNNHWSAGGRDTWLQWVFSSLTDRGEAAKDLCHIFTERPIYRPEEKVHVKGYARQRHHGRLTNLTGEGTVVIDGPGDDQWRLPVDLTTDGSFYVEFDEREIPTGLYRSRFEAPENDARCTGTFAVEAYRLPKFEVKILGPEVAPYDRSFEVKAIATYYAGGEVVGRPVRWRVTQYPYTWTPADRPGFLFSSDGRYSRTGRFDSTPARTTEDETNTRGESTLVLNPSIEPTAHPRTYAVEGTITGVDGQTVTASRRFNVVPAFIIGVKVPRFIERARVIEPEIILVGPKGEAIAGREITLRLKHRQWHSYLQTSDFTSGVAKYVSDVVDVPILEQTLTSTEGGLKPSLPIERAGVYLVEIEAQDKLGRAQVVATDLYAGGDEPVTWEKAEAGVFEVAASKAKYRPGDEATLVIQSPYQEARALVVVETPEVNRYTWLPVHSGKATYSLVVEEGWVPRLPVHVVLMRGRTQAGRETKVSAQDLDRPVTVASTAWLEIEPVENIVEVALEHPDKARPGETIPVTMRLKDPDGKPLAGEVTLWLVDQAILALRKEERLDPLPDFIVPRQSYLDMRDSRNSILGRIPFAKMPGGDEGEDDDSPLDKATVRKNFQPVPYYHPQLRVGAKGVLTVKVPLPDNLTVFKIRAKAISGSARFGVGTSEIAVRLPLLVQPALPRFVRPGDTFAATGIGRVVEGDPGPGAVEIKTDGLEIRGKSRRQVSWQLKEAQPLSFSVAVPMPPLAADGSLSRQSVEVTMGVSRQADGASDAFKVELPLKPDRRPLVIRDVVTLEKSGTVAKLAEEVRKGSLKRSVVVSAEKGIVRLAAALDALRQTPMHCTKQRLDRARAYLATVKLRDQLGMAAGRRQLELAVNDTMLWLEEVVDRHGLVANWPGGDGHVELTAAALQFLVEAGDAGFTVDRALRAGFARHLSQALRSDYRYFLSGESWYERTTALLAVTAHGGFEEAYFSELSRRAEFLSNEGIANVVLAAYSGGKGGSSVTGDLLRRVKSGVTVRLHQGREVYAGLREGRTDRSPMVLPSETRTLASMARALGLGEPESDRLPIVTEAIVGLADANGWGSTDADSAALLALTERLTRSAAADGRVLVREGGESRTLTLSGQQPVAHQSDLGPGEIRLQLEGRLGSAMALVRTQYLPAAPGSQERASANGFVVEQNLLLVQSGGAPPKRLRIAEAGERFDFRCGDIIEEQVRVVNPKLHHYVAINVPLAAGMEPLNPSLATAPPEATPSGRQTKRASYVAYYDDSVTFYFDELPKGAYDFYFRLRAMIAGEFVQPAASAELLFDPSVRGNSPGAIVAVAPEKE